MRHVSIQRRKGAEETGRNQTRQFYMKSGKWGKNEMIVLSLSKKKDGSRLVKKKKV